MQFKNFISALLILFISGLPHIYAKVCRTQEGVAWCEGDLCYYRTGNTFTAQYCRAASSDGTLSFNGSNCRRCPIKSCSIVTPSYTGKLNVYHNANGYFLTTNGWCYYGE